MDTNYDEWSDTAIAFEVMCRHLNPTEKKIEKGVAMHRTHEEEKWHEFNIDNPAHVWPVIVESGICTDPSGGAWQFDSESAKWHYEDGIYNNVDCQGRPLRAAMICFLKLTDVTND